MGNAVVHWEFMSKDPAKISTFYKKLFGWKINHIPKLNYRMVDTQGGKMGINGGIVKPKQKGPWPAMMTMYILVDDLAAYRKKIVKGGGKICICGVRL